MKAILSARGFGFNATDYAAIYGNEMLLKLQRKYTIRTVDRTTKIPQVTKLYTLIKCPGFKIIEFPRFVMNELVATIPSAKAPILEVDIQLPTHEMNPNIVYTGKSNSNQQIVVKHIVDKFKSASIAGETLKMLAGCHAINTDILMFDGTVKQVQDIEVGELIMGDDNTPRKVLNLVRGNDIMYQITNFKGEKHVINGDHIMCLKYTNKKSIRRLHETQYAVKWFFNESQTFRVKQKSFKTREEAQIFYDTITENLVVEVSLNNFLTRSKSFQKNFKQYKTSVEFPSIDTPIDPYMIGYWLGDGNTNTSVITSQDSTVLKYFATSLGQYNCYLCYQNTDGYAYRINGSGTGKVGSNSFKTALITLNLLHNKHIPHIYKCNSRENRLKLLAGIIDSDGCLTHDGCSFEFVQAIQHEQLFDDVLYLARSLGFACRKSKQASSWTYNGEKKSGFKLRMHISGAGTDEIPTLCPRKKANPRQQIKDVLVSQIKVERLENGDYYGFQLDGNHRYVMGSFVVTHNCGKSYAAMDIIGKMKRKTLIVVPNTYLLDQWLGLLSEYFPTATIGTLYGKQKQDGDIIVGIVNTLANLKTYEVAEKKPWPNIGKTQKYMKVLHTVSVDDVLSKVGLTIFDESHMYVSKEFRKVFQRIQSRYTLGLSATPDIREDKLDAIHQKWLGPILDAETLEGYSMSQDAFISDAHMINYHAHDANCQFKIRDDGMIEYTSIVEAIITDPYRNKLLIEEIVALMDKGLYTFVFSDRRSHLEHLYELLEARCIETNKAVDLELPEAERKVILYGGSTEATIDKAKRISTIVFTTYAYSSTGISIVRMNGLVLATPRRSNMKQIINRVFRLGSDQSVKRIIVDICDAKLPIKGQQRERVKAYQERGTTIIKSKVMASEITIE